MMADTMFASGNDAQLSMFNHGSGGSVTGWIFETLRGLMARPAFDLRVKGLLPSTKLLWNSSLPQVLRIILANFFPGTPCR